MQASAALFADANGLPEIGVIRLAHGTGLDLPAYATPGSAGMDLRAALDAPLTLRPGERTLVPSGFIIEIPSGFEGQVRPRSGLALKHGLTCLNTPGTIDSDYRGELKILLIHHGDTDFIIERGMRIAQLVIAPVVQARLAARERAGASGRGEGGFGSTGF